MIRRVDTFPQMMEGEALFSAIAFYHLWSGNSSLSQSSLDLFGHPAVRASVEFPVFIGALAQRLPPALRLGEVELALRHTQLKYITAFMPAHDAEKMATLLFKGDRRMHASFGMASVVARTSCLRFCQKCLSEMERRAGRFWWRIDHQLPGVMVCPDHGDVLRESPILLNSGQFTFVAATRDTCPENAPAIIDEPGTETKAKLIDIAVRSSQLMTAECKFSSFEEITDYYRDRLRQVGLMTGKIRIDLPEFERLWKKFYSDIDNLLESVFAKSDSKGAWVLEMVRKHKHAKHPLQHIIMHMFIDSLAKRTAPFGHGPWPCPNPVAGHGKGALTIARVAEHNRRGSVVGTFSCVCGYAYTMTRDPDGTFHGPRFRQFGPLLDEAVIRLTGQGFGLRAVAAKLGIHHRVVAETADRLKLEKPWTPPVRGPKPTGGVKEIARQARRADPTPRNRYVSQPRTDWAALDQEMILEVRTAVSKIKAASPVIAVSVKEIERFCGRGDSWLALRRDKLPLTIEVVKGEVETRAQFQERRLRDVILRNLNEGRLISVSMAIRQASLKYDIWSSRARELVEEISSSRIS